MRSARVLLGKSLSQRIYQPLQIGFFVLNLAGIGEIEVADTISGPDRVNKTELLRVTFNYVEIHRPIIYNCSNGSGVRSLAKAKSLESISSSLILRIR